MPRHGDTASRRAMRTECISTEPRARARARSATHSIYVRRYDPAGTAGVLRRLREKRNYLDTLGSCELRMAVERIYHMEI